MEKKIIMIGPSFDSKGGMSSVVSTYRQIGLFERWPIVYMVAYRDGTKLYKLFIALHCLVKFILFLMSGRVALVHVHVATRASFWRKSIFILISLLTKRPVIFHLHGAEFMQFYSNECGRVAKKYLRYILNHVSRIVVLSSQWRDQISQISKNKEITIIYNPIFLEKIQSHQTKREKNTLIFLGRLGERKGIFDLMKAVSELLKQHHEVKLVFGGDGDFVSVNELAEHLGITRSIEYVGWVTGDAKAKLLSSAAIYVLPSYNEGLPMGVLEAMAAGLPIVATSIGGIPDAVTDGVEGFLVKPGDITSLVFAIKKLLINDEVRGKMGEAARKKVEMLFASDKILPRLDKLYRAYDVQPAS